MAWMLVRHKVADFDRWKRVFDAHTPTHVSLGMKIQHVLRNIDDPDEVVFLFEVADIDKARAFTSSDDVDGVREEAGVTDEPDIYFLS